MVHHAAGLGSAKPVRQASRAFFGPKGRRPNHRIPPRFERAQERYPLLPNTLCLKFWGKPRSRNISERAPLPRQTLRFSAEVLPRLATSSYSTVCPSLSVERPAFSTAEI